MGTVRVVVADDQEAVRTGLVMILDAAGDIEVVAEAGDGVAAVRAAAEHTPDVVLMDIRMPGVDGIEATRRVLAAGSAQVLVLTTFDLDDHVDAALAAGAAGFLLKSVDATRLREAVHAVARGDRGRAGDHRGDDEDARLPRPHEAAPALPHPGGHRRPGRGSGLSILSAATFSERGGQGARPRHPSTSVPTTSEGATSPSCRRRPD